MTLRSRLRAGICTAGLLLTVFLPPALCQAAAPQPFVTGSYTQLLETRDDGLFVLSFWSIDCPPCYRELALWGEHQRQEEQLPLVLVSTDTPADAAEIEALLAQYGLESVDSWVFAAPAQRLRYEVDRRWHGELPRTYLVRNGTVVEAVTGIVDAARIQRWLHELD
ncbi:MAG: hypothetical protein WCY26_03380 [Thiohalobacteraceae bacterium]|nr:TlpA family protein disulfide reductase [Gammaproteobacteria bacterium]